MQQEVSRGILKDCFRPSTGWNAVLNSTTSISENTMFAQTAEHQYLTTMVNRRLEIG